MTDVADLLPLYALGILDPEESAAVERAIAANPALAAELAALQQVAERMVVPAAPASHVATRLTASIGAGRFAAHAARMAAIFDVSLDRAHEILGLVERPASWEVPFPGYGLSLVHFDGGPACATADCGFVRLTPGTAFPPHDHAGEEVSIILAGRLRDGDRVLGPGDELSQGAASRDHRVVAEGDTDCIYAARAEGGIEIGGVHAVYPRKP